MERSKVNMTLKVMSAETMASFIAVTMKTRSINIKRPSLWAGRKERYQTLPDQPEGLSSPSSLLRSFSKKHEKGSLRIGYTHSLSPRKKKEERGGINSWGKKSTSPSQSTCRDRVVLLRPLHWCAHTRPPPCPWITWKQTRLLRGAWTSLIRPGDSAGMEGEEEERVEFYTAAESRERGLTSWSGISEDRVCPRTVPVR